MKNTKITCDIARVESIIIPFDSLVFEYSSLSRNLCTKKTLLNGLATSIYNEKGARARLAWL